MQHVDSSISSSRRLVKVAMDFLRVAEEMSYNIKGKAVKPRVGGDTGEERRGERRIRREERVVRLSISQLRIGISTGEAYSGFVGSRVKLL
eukprot:755679-Hanusia_phi.AAC.1